MRRAARWLASAKRTSACSTAASRETSRVSRRKPPLRKRPRLRRWQRRLQWRLTRHPRPRLPPPRPSRSVLWRCISTICTWISAPSSSPATPPGGTFPPRLRPEDRVAIFTSSNQVGIDFTDARAKLHDALSRLAPHSRTDPLSQECPAIGEYQAYLIAERQDRNALDLAAEEARECCKTRGECSGDFSQRAAEIWDRAALQSLDALEVADGVIRRVASMPGQRILVLVSTGFLIATREREVGALIER